MENIMLTEKLVDQIRIQSFWETMFATFIGAVLAFVFSFLLFLLQEWLSEKRRKDKIKVSVIREIDYNLSYLSKYKNDLDDLIGKIQVNDRNVFTIMKYHYFQRLFLQQAFVEGLLYEKLNPDQIDKLASIFEWFGEATNTLGWNTINGYRQGSVTQATARAYFQYDINKIGETSTLLAEIKVLLEE